MNIGFIGCGNMATAIIKSIVNKYEENSIYIYDINKSAVDRLVNECNCIACESEEEVVGKGDAVVLAVKPNVLADVCRKISDNTVISETVIISIAAGKTIDYIQSNLGKTAKITRVMPNINAQVGEAVSAYCTNGLLGDKECAFVEELLSCFGEYQKIDEAYFPIFGVIGGCSPAFTYMYIDAMARAAVKNGMKKDVALKVCAQAVLGSAKMILESDKHPYELIDNVCSPGGTTIEGVTSLQSDGFESAVINAVDKAFDKDKRL